MFDQVENRIKQITSDPIIIVHMTASPTVIEKRMEDLSSDPAHSNSPLTQADIPEVLSEYERLVEKSTIGPVIKVDTSNENPNQTLNRVTSLLEQYFTESDRDRISAFKV